MSVHSSEGSCAFDEPTRSTSERTVLGWVTGPVPLPIGADLDQDGGMTRFAVLLRGVNVGAARRISMPTLRAALEGLGYTDVVTYLQSGNAVISCPARNGATVEKAVRAQLISECGIDTDVIVRTGPQLAATIAANPFPDAVSEPTRLYALFLACDPDPAGVAALDPATWAPDEFAIGPGCLYQRFHTSPARSKLSAGLAAKLKLVGTARNWNSVLALDELTR
jgi:uncharacterized protein (DUF1697 family)